MANKQKSQSVLGPKDKGIIDKKSSTNYENFEDYKQNFANTNIGFNIDMNNIGKKENLENNNNEINELVVEDIKEEN